MIATVESSSPSAPPAWDVDTNLQSRMPSPASGSRPLPIPNVASMILAGLVLATIAVTGCGGGDGGGSGGGGGGGGGSGIIQWGTRASSFDSVSSYTSNAAVQRCTGQGNITIRTQSTPPNIEGVYSVSGHVESSELRPQANGQPLTNSPITISQQSGGQVRFEQSHPVFGNVVANGAFIRGSASEFTILYAVETTVDLAQWTGGQLSGSLTETDIGIISGSKDAAGNLTVRVGAVVAGLRGSALAQLQAQGTNPDSFIGKYEVHVATLSPQGGGGSGGSLILSEDFEQFSTGTWPWSWTEDANATSDPLNNRVVSNPSGNGKVLKLYGEVGSFWGALGYYPVSLPQSFTLRIKVRNGSEVLGPGGHLYRGWIGLRNGTHWSQPSVSIGGFHSDNTLRDNGSNVVGTSTYSTSQWHDLKFDCWFGNGTWKVRYTVNGIQRGISSQAVSSGTFSSMTHLDLSAQAGSVWFDDIEITTLSEPMP